MFGEFKQNLFVHGSNPPSVCLTKTHFVGWTGCILDSLILCLDSFFFPPLFLEHTSLQYSLFVRTVNIIHKLVFGVEMCPLYFESAVILAISVQQETKHCLICNKVRWWKVLPVQLQWNFMQNTAVFLAVLFIQVKRQLLGLEKWGGVIFHFGASEITLMKGIKLYDLISTCKHKIK